MRQIDQRILIDAPLEVVWKMLTDPRELRGWHAGYTSVSILTTHETGEGVRRRCGLAETGKDVFEEITAWVDGLGYEYRVVEGGPYRSLTGRFRLQAMPDGTSVQWVITYQPKGLIGILRDRFSKRRAMTAMMADSLRELRRRVNAMGVKMDDDYRAKVGIRGRLDAEQRAQYQRRYPSPDEAAGVPVASGAAPAGPALPAQPVPSFVADLTEDTPGYGAPDYGDASDTKPRKPQGLAEAIQAGQGEGAPAMIESPLLREPPVSLEDTPQHGVTAAEVDQSAAQAASPLPYSGDAADFARPSTLPDLAPGQMPLGVTDDYGDETPFYQQITPPRGMPIVRPMQERPRTGEMDVVEPPDAVLPPGVVLPPETVLPPDTVLPPEAVMPPDTGLPPQSLTQAPVESVTSPDVVAPPEPVASPYVTPAFDQPLRPVVPPPGEIVPSRRAADPKRSTDLPPQTPQHDTGEISIWEVFGVQRPSDQDTAALNSLIRSAQARERSDLGERGARQAHKRPLRVRSAAAVVLGLRMRLALKQARVRLFWRK